MKSLYLDIEEFFKRKKLNKDNLSNIETLKIIEEVLKQK